MDDHYEEIHELVRKDYNYDFFSFQELIAEIVIKTEKYNRIDRKDRYDKIIYLLLGHPSKKTQHKGYKDDEEDLERIASLCTTPSFGNSKPFSLAKAIREVARQKYIQRYKLGDPYPKDIDQDTHRDIESYAKRLERKIKKHGVSYYAENYDRREQKEQQIVFEIEKDISLAKSFISEWLERYCKN